jgi:hypothetical protein
MQKFVPVVSSTGRQLMPTTNRKANKLIAAGRALRRFDRGLFYIRLIDREDGYRQSVAIGIDPGSKKEAITVKSAAHTFLNIQADAVDWVGEHVKTRRQMRRNRRYRKTPYRKCRRNRKVPKLFMAPSTRARWNWKLRLCRWLARYFPITVFVVEDIAAVTKPQNRYWNAGFSAVEVGKSWFYSELQKIAPVFTLKGYETKIERDFLGLKKSTRKLSDSWHAHCVDSWVLANWHVDGHTLPDNTAIMYIVPLRFHRRQLHRLQPEKGGIRKPYGGTLSLGFKRGSWVKHTKWGLCYIGGTTRNSISLHSLETGERIAKVKPNTVQFLTRAAWRIRKGGSSASVGI